MAKSIENGRELSDGNTYRADYNGQGYGYSVYRLQEDRFGHGYWYGVGRVHPKSDSERDIVSAVEKMVADDARWKAASSRDEEEAVSYGMRR